MDCCLVLGAVGKDYRDTTVRYALGPAALTFFETFDSCTVNRFSRQEGNSL